MTRLVIVLCLLLALPVLSVFGSWLAPTAGSMAVLQHQLSTVLPAYAGNSLLLTLLVAIGVGVIGSVTAALVTLFDFPARSWFEWALQLPLAMPAYVL
ncbi:MAG: iron ABC transporter permease, partial [Ideonella sp.]